MEEVFQETMHENLLKLMTDTKLQVQEAKETPNSLKNQKHM